jgi:antitoxin HigA-1
MWQWVRRRTGEVVKAAHKYDADRVVTLAVNNAMRYYNGGCVLSGRTATRTKLRSWTITERIMTRQRIPPIHPGEILLEEFLEPLAVSQYRLPRDINVPPRRINEIVHAKRGISADTALRLSRYFGTSERFWLDLQARFDLETQRDLLGDRLGDEVKVFRAAS